MMSKQVTAKMWWIQCETTEGTEFLKCADVNTPPEWDMSKLKKVDDSNQELLDSCKDDLRDYLEGELLEASILFGIGARLSNAGYLDCTPWAVFDTEEEAWESLEDIG